MENTKDTDREREEEKRGREQEEEKSEKNENGKRENCEKNENKNSTKSTDEEKANETDQTMKMAINEQMLAEELNKFGTFKKFNDEVTLNELYKAFICSPSVEKLLIIEQAAIIWEIKQRMEAIEQLEKVGGKAERKRKEKAKIIEKFEGILGKSAKNGTELGEVQDKLANLLLDTLKYYDGMSPIFFGMEIGQKQLKGQILTKYLAFAILKDNEIENIWTKSNKQKMEKALNLMRENQTMEIGQFEGMAKGWKKMFDQIQIDKAMYEEFAELTIFLGQFIVRNLPPSAEHSEEHFDQQTNAIINSVRCAVDGWRGVRLLLTGSHLLGTQTFDSDIDLICVVPGKSVRQSDFFGKAETECKANKCSEEKQKQKSLFCILCENENVSGIVKINYGTVPMLKLKFGGFDVDISFVSIPDRKNLPNVLSEETIEKYLNKFYSEESAKFDKQIRILSSYCSNLYIKNLLMEGHKTENHNENDNEEEKSAKVLKNLRLMVTTLKLWAKSNFIYSNKFGFLNGVSLTIMATKIILLYPNAPILFLLEKFYLIYAKRETKVPIKLKLVANESDKKHFDEKKIGMEEVMRIYTSSFPEQNTAKNVTHSTEKIIRRNMDEALNRIKKMASESIDWSILMVHSEQFTQKFVESRIRLQLVYDIDQRGGSIETQLYPEIYEKSCKMPENLVKTMFRQKFCRIWLVGLKPSAFLEQAKKELPFFDLTIKRAYLKFNPPTTEKGQINLNDIEENFEKLKFNLKSLILSAHELNELNDERAERNLQK
ncbi:hypothetical protein niasHT_019478 [Heterodera trifolii]|uniref:polynucleotide adenylyltransferase n=1 Tax=Heterodera trifolii TaxID=157864 RepID=A0ABD2KWM7_9BILA